LIAWGDRAQKVKVRRRGRWKLEVNGLEVVILVKFVSTYVHKHICTHTQCVRTIFGISLKRSRFSTGKPSC
jgi:hypothetical protein